MNATVMAYGMAVGGREGARQMLRDFWRRVSDAALFSPFQPSFYDRLMRKIIKEGVKTRVLMLSATPVNNRMADLRNQIAFATEGDTEDDI